MYSNGNGFNINNNCFDIIRIVCTFTVFSGHFFTHFDIENTVLHEMAYFFRGVPVFFFLSGLFIARSLERYNLREFLQRRVARIFPELWGCVLFNLVLILLVVHAGGADVLIYIATQMTIFQFYTGDWLRGYGVGVPNGALWTITVDIQFYLVAIFLAKWLKKCELKNWVLLIIMAMGFDLWLEKISDSYPMLIYKLLYVNLFPFIWIFLIGMCIYYYREKIAPILIMKKYYLLILYLFWQYMMPGEIVSIFDGIRYNLVTTCIMILMLTGVGFSYNWRSKQDYSYSFYLYHMVVINFIINNIGKSFTNAEYMLVYMGSIAVIGIFAIFSHKYIAGSLTKKLEERILLQQR